MRPLRCQTYHPLILSGVLVCLVWAGLVRAQDGYRSSGAKFLTIGGGARALAMGETYLVEESDPFALFYNPASLPTGLPTRVGLAHNAYFQDAHGEYAALHVPYGRMNWGLAMQMFVVPGIPRRAGPTERPLGDFDALDALVLASAAYSFSPKVRAGVALKGVFEKIDAEAANGIAFDLGGTYRVTERIAVGAALNHLGPELKFARETFKLPSVFRLGGGYATRSWMMRGELLSPNNEGVKFHVGGEYQVSVAGQGMPAESAGAQLALRAGYAAGYDTRSWSAGFGIGLRHIEIDYAFVPYDDDLGNTHRFAVVLTLQ